VGAGAIHLASGARRLPFFDYLIGTLLSLVPVVAAIAALGAMFRHLILHPSVWNSVMTMAAAFALIALAGLVRMAVLIRQFRPAAAQQLSRAEFG
jgi:hypothetical protein